MFFRRPISRLQVGAGVFNQAHRIFGSGSNQPFKALNFLSGMSDQSSPTISRVPEIFSVASGPKASSYAAEATAEHVGRLAKNMGLKSIVVKVNGFTYFKKKKQAILSFREGYTNSRGDKNSIVYIEVPTRRPHNGCRLPKRRRVKKCSK